MIGLTTIRPEQYVVRARMLDLGMTHADVAEEFIRRYSLRPRTAFRHAHGWTQEQAAEAINHHAARLGVDPDGKAPIVGSLVCTFEKWPSPAAGSRRLTPHMLVLMAVAYGTDVHSLVDAHDRPRLRPMDQLVINSIVCIGQDAHCLRMRQPGPAARAPIPARPVSLASAAGVAVTA
jgi:hypothetical protein